MWLGNGTVAYTAQLSDKHRCATFDWPDKAIILLYVILYSSKHFDLLHLSYSGSYVWILSVAAGDSSWFCFSILVVWVMTEVQSYQHVFFFFSYDCFSAWSSVWLGKKKKRMKNNKDSESTMISMPSNLNCNFAKKPAPESLESILTSKHLCLLLFQMSFCWNSHLSLLNQLLLTTLILHFWLV